MLYRINHECFSFVLQYRYVLGLNIKSLMSTVKLRRQLKDSNHEGYDLNL